MAEEYFTTLRAMTLPPAALLFAHRLRALVRLSEPRPGAAKRV
jgi:hypothetical protein